MLHITNGDNAAALIAEAGPEGDILPWRDVLTDGPVPGGHGLEELSEIRARFLGRAYGDREETRRAFAARDAALRGAMAGSEEIVLWFEHDLYDQLQLLQILDVLADAIGRPPVALICIDRHPAVDSFRGLAQLDAGQIAALFPKRVPVNDDQFALSRRAWAAFTAADPAQLEELLSNDLSALPFLGAALARWREEFPWAGDGLGLTERRILQAIDMGDDTPAALFRAVQKAEAAPFLGDWSVWTRVAELVHAPHPLLACAPGPTFRHPPQHPADDAFRDQHLRLTQVGRAVLAGTVDELSINGIDRWYGGLHFAGGRPHWRWDPTHQHLVRYQGRRPAA